jgi:hypothetical protein
LCTLSLSFFGSDVYDENLGDAEAVAFAEALKKNTHLKIVA